MEGKVRYGDDAAHTCYGFDLGNYISFKMRHEGKSTPRGWPGRHSVWCHSHLFGMGKELRRSHLEVSIIRITAIKNDNQDVYAPKGTPTSWSPKIFPCWLHGPLVVSQRRAHGEVSKNTVVRYWHRISLKRSVLLLPSFPEVRESVCLIILGGLRMAK